MNKILSFLLALSTVSFATPLLVFAQGLQNPTSGKIGTIGEFICLMIKIVQTVGIPILAVCIIYAGYTFLNARGNESEISKAKAITLWTIVGAIIVLGAPVIANFISGTANIFDPNIGNSTCN